MEGGLDSAIDTLKDILNQPDAADTISSMLGAIGLGEAKTTQSDTLPALPVEKLLPLMEAYKSLGNTSDDRVKLLRAVRPFLRKSRQSGVDTAIQLLTMLRLMPLLGDLKDLI